MERWRFSPAACLRTSRFFSAARESPRCSRIHFHPEPARAARRRWSGFSRHPGGPRQASPSMQARPFSLRSLWARTHPMSRFTWNSPGEPKGAGRTSPSQSRMLFPAGRNSPASFPCASPCRFCRSPEKPSAAQAAAQWKGGGQAARQPRRPIPLRRSRRSSRIFQSSPRHSRFPLPSAQRRFAAGSSGGDSRF